MIFARQFPLLRVCSTISRKAAGILVALDIHGQLSEQPKQFDISAINEMIKNRNVLLYLVTGIGIACAAITYKNEISIAVPAMFETLSSLSERSAPNPRPDAANAPLKAEVNLLIQQQAQKITAQAPVEDEPSDAENLQNISDALTELEHAEDEYDRELAVMALGGLQGPAAQQGLLTALRDSSDLVVTQAIRQINSWQDPKIRTDMLLIALQSDDQRILEQTLTTITAVDDKRLTTRLKQLSKHSDSEIREAAKLALNLAP